MGTNKRYAEAIDRRMSERIDETVMRDHEPFTLTPAELELDRLPLTRTPTPETVKVWIRYGTHPLKLEAQLVAWTPRACAVRWTTPAGDEHRAWVWASAVERP